MTNAANINYGVEIETTVPHTANINCGRYHRGLAVNGLPGWTVESDSSIVAGAGRHGAEFVSGVMCGEDGLRSIKQACEFITEKGGRVNRSCGIHVTVTFDGGVKALERLISLVASFEKALFASTGTKSRERGRWAKGLKQYGSADRADRNAKGDRYHMLNLTHVARGRNRVEFRIFSGSLNSTKIIAWVRLCLALVELAAESKRAVKWTSDASRWAANGAGEGQADMRRLFHKIGWTKGHTAKEFGAVSSPAPSLSAGGLLGQLDQRVASAEIPSTKELKKKLIEMAKKYDAQA